MDKPWLNPELDVESRVELLLARMTLAEKVGQLNQPVNVDSVLDVEIIRAGGIGTSLVASGAFAGNVRDDGVAAHWVNEVQRVAVTESRLGIPILIARDVIHGYRTVLPIPLGQAATWDVGLVERGARLAAGEASAVGINWTFAPMMDVTGDHRWGRIAESLGEDPVLAGRMAAAMVHGFQTDDMSAPDAIAATAKHYVGYGLAEGGRDYNTVIAGENHIRNLALRPFHEAVKAGVATVMASFNDLDGVPVHGNRRYLREILKQEWGWDGAVVSDWEGIAEIVWHRVAADRRDAGRMSIEAGVDIDMVSRVYEEHLANLVTEGAVPIASVDEAVRRVLRLKFRCGLFERPYVDQQLAERARVTSQSRALAREAAAASMVLLTNNGVLPLRPQKLGRILLTGPMYEATDALFGTWTLDGRAADVVSIAAAMRLRIGDPGCSDEGLAQGQFAQGQVREVPWTHSDEVLQQAREADTLIAFVGEHPCRSGEANSVTQLVLPPGQLEVLQAMRALGKRLVAVVFGGRPLSLGWLVDNCDALLWAWHPGTEGGNAVVDVLFGDSPPRGRLPVTFPRTPGQLPVTYNARSTGRPIPRDEDPRRGRYQDSLTTPLFPFGFGLTFGNIQYGPVRLDRTDLTADGQLTASVTVHNIGDRDAVEVVQCYIRDDVAQITRPMRELYDFSMVDCPAGAKCEVSFTITADRLGYYGQDNAWRVDPGTFALWIAPDAMSGAPVAFSLG